jgi:hypothetical protein
MSGYPMRRAPALDELPLFTKGGGHVARTGSSSSGAAENATGRRPSPVASFDLDRGLTERDRGIARITLSNADFVARMREEAVRIALERGSVHVDDLRRRAGELEIAPTSSAAWGAVFAHRGRWRKGGYRPSTWVGNHGHASPVWELVEGAR